MQTKDYKSYFDKMDAELLKISPHKDIMLLCVIASIIPVVCFGLDALYGMPVLYRLGMPFYLFCLGIYLEGFLKALLLMRKVSAEFITVRLSKLYLRLHELPGFERFSFLLSRGNKVNHRLTLE